MLDQIREQHADQPDDGWTCRADQRPLFRMRLDIAARLFRYELRGAADFVDRVKSHEYQGGQYNIDVLKIIKLPEQRGSRQGNRIFVVVDDIQAVEGAQLGMMRTDLDAFPAVDAEFSVNMRFSVPDPDRSGRTLLQAVGTSGAQVVIKIDRMRICLHMYPSKLID